MNGLQEMRKLIAEGDIDVLRTLVKEMAEALMSAEVDALCGAGRGERSPERVNRRNGYRERTWDTRSGTIDLAVPKLREGSYFPDWLLTPRRRSEQALVAAIADAYLAGVSTRRVDKLVRSLGIEGISKSQVSRLAASLDETVAAYRSRPLSGPYPYLALDALVVKVREGGRIASVAAVHAVGAARASGSSSSRARTAPAGRASCAASWPVAWPASCWSRATPTRASSTPSGRPCPVPPGRGAARTLCATS